MREIFFCKEELPISPDENAGSLHDRLMEMGAKLVVKTLDGLAEKFNYRTT